MQIIAKLREVEVELGRSQKTGEVCRKLGIMEQTFYRWRKEYGGLRMDQARRLEDLERENARPKKVVADHALDNAISMEAAKRNFRARPGDDEPWNTCRKSWEVRRGGRGAFSDRRARRRATARERSPERPRRWRE